MLGPNDEWWWCSRGRVLLGLRVGGRGRAVLIHFSRHITQNIDWATRGQYFKQPASCSEQLGAAPGLQRGRRPALVKPNYLHLNLRNDQSVSRETAWGSVKRSGYREGNHREESQRLKWSLIGIGFTGDIKTGHNPRGCGCYVLLLLFAA